MLKTPVTPECAAEISNIGPCQPGKEETFKPQKKKQMNMFLDEMDTTEDTDLSTVDKQRVAFLIMEGICTEKEQRFQHFDENLL